MQRAGLEGRTSRQWGACLVPVLRAEQVKLAAEPGRRDQGSPRGAGFWAQGQDPGLEPW